MSTPAGDLSGLLVLAWQADALLIATITAVTVTSPVGGSVLTATAVIVAMSSASACHARTRSPERSPAGVDTGVSSARGSRPLALSYARTATRKAARSPATVSDPRGAPARDAKLAPMMVQAIP